MRDEQNNVLLCHVFVRPQCPSAREGRDLNAELAAAVAQDCVKNEYE